MPVSAVPPPSLAERAWALAMGHRLSGDDFAEHLPELLVTPAFRKPGAAPERIEREKVSKQFIDLAGIEVRAMPVVFLNDSWRNEICGFHREPASAE